MTETITRRAALATIGGTIMAVAVATLPPAPHPTLAVEPPAPHPTLAAWMPEGVGPEYRLDVLDAAETFVIRLFATDDPVESVRTTHAELEARHGPELARAIFGAAVRVSADIVRLVKARELVA
jgi:hypothetical protein